MLQEMQDLTTKLEKLIATKLIAEGVEAPPRLVRANSAFALAKSLAKLQGNPDFVALLRDYPTEQT